MRSHALTPDELERLEPGTPVTVAYLTLDNQIERVSGTLVAVRRNGWISSRTGAWIAHVSQEADRLFGPHTPSYEIMLRVPHGRSVKGFRTSDRCWVECSETVSCGSADQGADL